MFFDYYLKFQDEASFEAVSIPETANVDVIGLIPTVDATGAFTGWEVGFHVNVRSVVELPELTQFVINPTPVSPYRVWA